MGPPECNTKNISANGSASEMPSNLQPTLMLVSLRTANELVTRLVRRFVHDSYSM